MGMILMYLLNDVLVRALLATKENKCVYYPTNIHKTSATLVRRWKVGIP